MVARNFVRWSVCGFTLLTAAALLATGLRLSLDGIGYNIITMIISSLLCGQIYRSWGNRGLDRVVYGLESFGLFSLITIVGAIFTYAMASVSQGWIDDYLIVGDRALGLNWPEYWFFVQRHAALEVMLRVGYMSIFLTPIICFIMLASIGQIDRCYRFIAAYLIALMMTAVSLAIFPAHSAEAHFLGVHAGLPEPGLAHIPIIEGLRNGTIQAVNLADMKGLITFPSFHAASSILFVWGLWSIRWMRLPSLAINGLMMAATPLQGGHYFVDVVGGVIVSLAAIATSERLLRVGLRKQLDLSLFRPRSAPLVVAKEGIVAHELS